MVLSSVAGRTVAFDIGNAVKSALAIDPSLKSGEMKIRSAESRAAEKKGLLLPSLNISTSLGAIDQIKPSKSYHRFQNYSVRVSQPVYQAERWDGYQEAHVEVRISANQYLQAKEELLYSIARQFIGICRLKAQQQIYRRSMYYTSQGVERQKKLFQFGFDSELNLLEATVELNRYQSKLDVIQRSLHQEADKFAQITDISINTNELKTIERTEIDPVTLLEISRTGKYWIDAAWTDNLSLRDLLLKKELQELKKNQSYHALKPTVDISLTHQRSLDFAEETSHSHSITGSISFVWNISPFFTYHNIKANDANYQAIHFEEIQLKKSIQQEIQQILADIERNRMSLNTFRKIALQQQEVLKLYLKGFTSKHYSISKVIEAAKADNEIEMNLNQSYFDIWEDAFRLFKAAGRLTEEQMAVLNYFAEYKE